MKSFRKMKALLMAAALILGVLATPGTSVLTAEAASKVTVKKVAAVDSLTGSKTIYLAKGKKAKLKTTVTVTPDESANKQVTYKSSSQKVATVTSKGVITGKKKGTATITVTSKKNKKKKATVTVKVFDGKVTGIKLNKTSGTLWTGKSVKLKANVKVNSGGSKKVVWTTSNPKVATVKKGTVKAVSAGKATITVKAADGSGKKASYKVTVKMKKNATDVAALNKIIKEQNARGAKVPTDLNDKAYVWGSNGRLKEIYWYKCNLQGSISFGGLKALECLTCADNQLKNLGVKILP